VSEHTPGPWELHANAEITKGDRYIACVGDPSFLPRTSDLANALLIVAAPDLLDVAKRYAEWHAKLVLSDAAWVRGSLPTLTQELCDELVDIQDLRNAAINKVKGKTP
jgi:hypothetical protein